MEQRIPQIFFERIIFKRYDIWSCQRFEIKNTHFIFSQSYLYEEDINESSNKQISIKLNDFPLFTLAELLLETLLVSFCN